MHVEMRKVHEWTLIAVVLVAVVNIANSGWCSRTICTQERQRVCVWNTWQGCCAYKWIWKPVTREERYCCSGYKGSNCNIPICNPTCANGGKCTSPGVCRCARGYEGPFCKGVAPCSYKSPCYPGICDQACTCQTNFTNPTCLQLKNTPPQVFLSRVRLVSLKVSTDPKLNRMMMYELIADSSNPNEDVVDEIWCNQKGFNKIEVNGAAQFDPQNLFPRPTYVSDAEFGVTSAVATVTHDFKVRGGGKEVKNYTCQEVEGDNIAPFWNCTKDDQFKNLINNGDELDVQLTFQSGGYRKLKNPDNKRYSKRESYRELSSQKRLKFKFDLELPVHCSRNSCPSQPLTVIQEITKDPVRIRWEGWSDALSGMHRYAWEIFRLKEFTADGKLREQDPLKPIINTGWFVSNGTFPIRYTPPGPGLYSVILEASDLANNSRYARRLFLYDNVSNVTVSDASDKRLYVSSAADNTGNKWQSNLNGVINVKWTGHFINRVHHENKLLNAVLEYPPQFTDIVDDGSFTQKSISFDDNEGKRTLNEIPNVLGIVNFEISYDRDHRGGTTLSPSTWHSINQPTSFVIPKEQRTNGDTVRVWVRATDIMGNQKFDDTTVSFDNTKPSVTLNPIQRNIDGGKYPYSSIASIDTFDEESGIWGVNWQLSRDSTSEVMKTGELDLAPNRIRKTDCDSRPSECRCAPNNECFLIRFTIVINHCWFIMDRNGLESEVITMEINVTNPAMLTTTVTIKIDKLPTLKGIDECIASRYVGLSAGAKAGIGVSVTLIIIIIIAAVLLWYFGIIAVVIGKKKEGPMTKAAVAFSRMSRKVRGAAVDDDIYVYGGDNFDIPIGAQIAASRLTLEELITEGKFARIYRATLLTGNETKSVVAKLLRANGDPEDRKLMKGKILFYLNEVGEHRNVLRMLGTVLENDDWGPVMVLEYCEMGPMRTWLVKQKGAVSDDVIERMFQFAYGIVQGMVYLAQVGIVHRRLAARNILLTFLLEVRITGFGPTSMDEGEEEEADNSKKERIPLRWVAPECIKSTNSASEKSDVWSYGIVLWEIFSLGDNPYPTLKTHEIPVKVKAGHRMSKPEYADEYNYELMQQCWDAEAKKRPKFRDLEKAYTKIMSGGGNQNAHNYTNYSRDEGAYLYKT